MIAAEWDVGQVVWVLIWLSLLIVFARLVFATFVLVVRAPHLSGWGKARWTLGIIAVPLVGIVTLLVVDGGRVGPNRVGAVVDLPPPMVPTR